MLCWAGLAVAGTSLHSITKQCVWILKCVERETCISGLNLAYKLVLSPCFKEFYEAGLTLLKKQLEKLSIIHKSFRTMSHRPHKPIR